MTKKLLWELRFKPFSAIVTVSFVAAKVGVERQVLKLARRCSSLVEIFAKLSKGLGGNYVCTAWVELRSALVKAPVR